jgi:hypothetical protein
MEYDEENHNDLGSQELARERGQRAEEVAQWYFRLNGFFLIPGFIVHPDAPRPTPRTEADLLGVRLSYSTEGVWRRQQGHNFRDGVVPISMKDHDVLTNSAKVGTVIRHLVAMVEVKAGICEINGPWSDRSGFNNRHEPTNMERALARVGFGNRTEVNAAAEKMFEDLRYEGSQFVVQYFAVGRTSSSALKQAYPKLVQITFDEIGTFLGHRFSRFPEKIPGDRDIALWHGFGDKFRWWFEGNASSRGGPSEIDCQRAIKRYIDNGRCHVVV